MSDQLTIDGKPKPIKEDPPANPDYQRSLFLPTLQVPKVPAGEVIDPLGTGDLFEE